VLCGGAILIQSCRAWQRSVGWGDQRESHHWRAFLDRCGSLRSPHPTGLRGLMKEASIYPSFQSSPRSNDSALIASLHLVGGGVGPGVSQKSFSSIIPQGWEQIMTERRSVLARTAGCEGIVLSARTPGHACCWTRDLLPETPCRIGARIR